MDPNKSAEKASEKAYCPYSQFKVGATVVTSSGQSFSGCNVENVSFGLTICAERNAIGQMVAAGSLDLKEVHIHTPTPTPTLPCGACRQVIAEFGDDIKVVSTCSSKQRYDGTIRDLLPHAFPKDAVKGKS